uniref:Conserved oligomeric Golgi complex subunit 1 n=1 Tax=Ananas comosus var. bracteatus TaxID=296719 RepID=A0A6V7NNJ0_ANACO|nr:unnamed protein product [Ananas comosus var. bracteatus]
MRSPRPRAAAGAADTGGGGGGTRDAESLFRTKPIPEIRAVEASVRREIQEKKEELRQLVGRSYRDLIDSADSILLMKSSCESISSNLAAIDAALASLSSEAEALPSPPPPPSPPPTPPAPASTASRPASTREVHGLLLAPRGAGAAADLDVLAKFPLLRHQWQIVESFKAQISQRSRDRLLDRGIGVAAYADALAAAATIDELDPKQVLSLFLDSRKSWILQKLGSATSDLDSCSSVLCDVAGTIRSTLGQVGELFVLASNEMPLFYQTMLTSPPGTQLFGASQIQRRSGEGLGSAEKLLRNSLNGREGLEESLEQWLRSVLGTEVESPWDQIRGLILKDGKDILEDRLEKVFMQRMKGIVHSEFENLSKDLNLRKTNQKKVGILHSLKPIPDENDFQSCLNSYFGPEEKCFKTISIILKELEDELGKLSGLKQSFESLRSPKKQHLDSPRRQTVAAAAALFGGDDSTNSRLNELNRTLQELCIKAHSLWIIWVSRELANILSEDLKKDDALSASTPLPGWEVTVVKQEGSTEGPLEMQIALPSMPSLQKFGVNAKEEPSRSMILKTSFRRKPLQVHADSATIEPVTRLISRLSQRLDPIDWATYELYLWENEKQSYKRYAVLFGFFVQLNRLYTETVQKLPTKSNTDSNIMRCSKFHDLSTFQSVSRFSAPALSSRGTHKSSVQTSLDDPSSRSPLKSYSRGEQSTKPEFDDSSSFGVATPLLKSFMTQVGSKFGESTSRWGSMLSDGQVGKLSTFGDILPGPAAGLLSSLTSGGARFDS